MVDFHPWSKREKKKKKKRKIERKGGGNHWTTCTKHYLNILRGIGTRIGMDRGMWMKWSEAIWISYSSIAFSRMALNSKGWNLYPSALKNLFWNSTQCRRSACRKHSRTSMHSSTPNVTAAKTAYPKKMSTGLFVSIIDTIACYEGRKK